MVAIMLVLGMAWLTVHVAAGTPIAGLLRRIMIDAPARRLNRITRGHVLTTAMLLMVGGLLIWQLEGDGVRLLSLMAPEIGTWLTMFEISAWLDAMVAVVALSSTVRLRGWRLRLTAIAARWLPRGRARRSRPIRPAAANDDDGVDRRQSVPVCIAA